jgi:hypothetical protein
MSVTTERLQALADSLTTHDLITCGPEVAPGVHPVLHRRGTPRGLTLFERIYAPLTVGLLQPFHGDSRLQEAKRQQLDCLYQRIVEDLDALLAAVGLRIAA